MRLNWMAPVVPGKSMFNLGLGVGYASVLKLLKKYEVALNVIRIDNSHPMRLSFCLNEEAIFLKTINNENYDWKSDVALMLFDGGKLKSITTYLNDPYSYLGYIFDGVGLGDQMRQLEKCFVLEYNDADESIYTLNEGKISGLVLYGASCDLSIDPNQKICAMKVFLVD